MLTISELYYYPLKSARGIAVESLPLDQRGPVHDRQWMVVTESGKFVTQRQHPTMCLIETRVVNGQLSLAAPGMPDIDVTSTRDARTVVVWNDTVEAVDCGSLAADWVTRFIGKACRVVEMPTSCARLVNPEYASGGETVSFADGFPLLITSTASLEKFNTALPKSITMERFRPNIVIAGCPPYAEDGWHEINLGSIKASLVKPCSRCIIPSVDPRSGDKQLHVNDALMATRRRAGKTYFGQNALHRTTGTLRVGDIVTVTQTRTIS